MKTTPFLTLLYGLIVFLSGVMEFQEKVSTLHSLSELLVGLVIFISSLYMTFRSSVIPYIFSALSCIIIFIIYGIFFYRTMDLYHGIFISVSGYIFILQLLELWKFYGKPQA